MSVFAKIAVPLSVEFPLFAAGTGSCCSFHSRTPQPVPTCTNAVLQISTEKPPALTALGNPPDASQSGTRSARSLISTSFLRCRVAEAISYSFHKYFQYLHVAEGPARWKRMDPFIECRSHDIVS